MMLRSSFLLARSNGKRGFTVLNNINNRSSVIPTLGPKSRNNNNALLSCRSTITNSSTTRGGIKKCSQFNGLRGLSSSSSSFMPLTTFARNGSMLSSRSHHANNMYYKGLRVHGNNTNTRWMLLYNNQQNKQILYLQLGSLTHFSSSGGSGRRPNPFFQGGGGGNRISQGLGLASAAAVLFGKGKYILGALKLTKFASLGSMVLSIGAYSMVFGLPYAAGMVGLMLVHEAGHALVMMQRGIPFSPMVFIPFMGAVIAMKKHPQDAYENALIAFGGPVLGSIGAGGVAVAASMTESQLLYALADFGFMVNAFNLLPIGSLDGGHITDALSPYAGVAGLGIGGTLVYTGAVSHPIMYLVLLTGGYQTFTRFYYPHDHPPNYYNISTSQRAALTAGYFGLIGAIFAGMAANHRHQKPPEMIQRERMNELSWDMR